MKIIDMENDPRKSHFAFFSSMAYPYVGITANVDVTNLIQYAKARKQSTFLAVLWAAARAANAVPEIRRQVVNGKVVEFDHCQTSHTVSLPDHTFCPCVTDSTLDLDDFLEDARQRQEAARQNPGFVATDADESGMIFVSCAPWLAFTQVIQPAPIPGDYNPRIIFGKYMPQGDRTLMPLHIQCNHALVDGFHICEFYRIFQEIADQL